MLFRIMLSTAYAGKYYIWYEKTNTLAMEKEAFNIYYNTKAEAEAVLSKYLNSLSPEEFAEYIAERILKQSNDKAL